MLETFHKYMGTGLIMIWYLAAVLFLFLKEKRRPQRVMFLYAPVMLLLLFFNPLFVKFFVKFLEMEIYFRTIWLLPMPPTLAYSIVLLCSRLKGRRRLIFGFLAAVLVMISGTLVYRSPLFSKAENIHHVPWEVVEICDRIKLEGREVRAMFPAEHLLYVRQYSAAVCMPYGRDAMQGVICDELYLLMQRDEIDVQQMAQLAKAKYCHYLIFSEEKTLIGNLEDYSYEFFGQVGKYLIYKDTTMNYSLTRE